LKLTSSVDTTKRNIWACFPEFCPYSVPETRLKVGETQRFGFLKNRSTDTAFFHRITHLIDATGKNSQTIAVYLDFEKVIERFRHFLSCKVRDIETPGTQNSTSNESIDRFE